ncbi:hypothetical protein V6N13_118222 [Hibiscus sabdariffa]|uniref:Uncharacterized protein n=1 Tax=Hibiscus sabdariffa TaxID=183260 RepID=A0ABR2Q8F4_9ROSI
MLLLVVEGMFKQVVFFLMINLKFVPSKETHTTMFSDDCSGNHINLTDEIGRSELKIQGHGSVYLKEWLEQTLPCISTYEKELVTKIMDPSLIVDEDLLEEVWAMTIVARSCLNPKSTKRPSMKHILKALENPLKVVQEECFNSGKLRTTSSRWYWSSAFFGSWRQSSSESATKTDRSSHKRLSNEVFPERETQDTNL